ncbi:MAG: dihydropteroate synthase [Lachnospiraceae bacterium]|nr:dihydropteroate synthase [Lachnospiraceae bacterium]
MRIGNREFDLTKGTYVMGIMNVTPDSFSDGGNFITRDAILFHAKEMVEAGADIIDVGGESTRPGYTKISDEEEIERVCPAIEMIKAEFDIPISLDTYKSQVANAGIETGADMINDIWGLQYDNDMGKLIADSGVAYCLMHNRSQVNEELELSDFLTHMDEDFKRSDAAGIFRDRILYDPGIGFAKTQEQNLLLIGNLDKMVAKAPVLLGTSRKSVINYVLDLPVNERVEGTLATTAEAVFSGVSMVRVHDVKENVRFIKMLERTREKWVK